jgi:(p)ppGpp synthase/HD superfamily hydrolase
MLEHEEPAEHKTMSILEGFALQLLEDKFYLSTNQGTVFHVSNVLRISDLAFLVKFLIGHYLLTNYHHIELF